VEREREERERERERERESKGLRKEQKNEKRTKNGECEYL